MDVFPEDKLRDDHNYFCILQWYQALLSYFNIGLNKTQITKYFTRPSEGKICERCSWVLDHSKNKKTQSENYSRGNQVERYKIKGTFLNLCRWEEFQKMDLVLPVAITENVKIHDMNVYAVIVHSIAEFCSSGSYKSIDTVRSIIIQKEAFYELLKDMSILTNCDGNETYNLVTNFHRHHSNITLFASSIQILYEILGTIRNQKADQRLCRTLNTLLSGCSQFHPRCAHKLGQHEYEHWFSKWATSCNLRELVDTSEFQKLEGKLCVYYPNCPGSNNCDIPSEGEPRVDQEFLTMAGYREETSVDNSRSPVNKKGNYDQMVSYSAMATIKIKSEAKDVTSDAARTDAMNEFLQRNEKLRALLEGGLCTDPFEDLFELQPSGGGQNRCYEKHQ